MEDKMKESPKGKDPKTDGKVDKKEEGKTLTQEQFDKSLAKRLSEATAKIKLEADESVKEAKAEAKRLAKLTADEREKELKAKSERELSDKMTAVSKRENRLDAIEKFTEAKVPANLVDYVLSDDKEKTLENAETFIKSYSESVSKSVAEQLKGTPPKDIADNSKNSTTDKKVVTQF